MPNLPPGLQPKEIIAKQHNTSAPKGRIGLAVGGQNLRELIEQHARDGYNLRLLGDCGTPTNIFYPACL